MADGIEFDWDDGNTKHLATHEVTPDEFEKVLNNDPLDLDYELIDNEERYRSVGLTSGGRLLSVVFTVRPRTRRLFWREPNEQNQTYSADVRHRG